MTCDIHRPRRNGKPCPWCGYAASSDPKLVQSAVNRSARVAGKPYDAEKPETVLTAEPTTVDRLKPPRFAWLRRAKACPARVRVGCGCNGEIYCRARELARVTPEDCRICLQTRTPGAEAPGVPSSPPPQEE